jgi:hypothetical protein
LRAARADQSGLLQRGKVERQPGRCQAKALGNLARSHARIPPPHQQADQVQPGLVRQGRKGCQNLAALHFTFSYRSTIQERLK